MLRAAEPDRFSYTEYREISIPQSILYVLAIRVNPVFPEASYEYPDDIVQAMIAIRRRVNSAIASGEKEATFPFNELELWIIDHAVDWEDCAAAKEFKLQVIQALDDIARAPLDESASAAISFLEQKNATP